MEDDRAVVTAAGFRSDGAEALEWVARYLESLERVEVSPCVTPGDIVAQLPAHAPEQPEPFASILQDLDRVIVPGLTHWQAPGFFAYFPASASPPSVLGELVSAGLGVNCMLWSTSPACTELEMVVLDWLVGLLGLPDHFRSASQGGGVIEDSASSATLCALVAARERALGAAPLHRLTIYGTSEAHSSLAKGAKIAGFAQDQLRRVPVRDDFSMDASALSRMVQDDRAAGLVPCFVLATAGTTSSMAFDPLEEIGVVCRDERLWLHVDAAMAGSAAICPELRAFHDGIELADSYAFNPHKWLLTNFDCTCFYVRDRKALTDALSVTPEYLRNPATSSGAVVDYRDWQVPLGRRFRALKLWFVLRTYGAEGLRRHVRRHLALTDELRARLEADERFVFCAPPALDLLCFAHVRGNAVTEQLLRDVNGTRRVLLSHTVLAGRYTIRCAIGGAWTERCHLDELWEIIDRLAPPVSAAAEEPRA
jgi:aromatic-L-amino-acid decarboxylase